jgi:hypothetical protein
MPVLPQYFSFRRDIIALVGQAKKKFLSQKSSFLWIKSCGKCG